MAAEQASRQKVPNDICARPVIHARTPGITRTKLFIRTEPSLTFFMEHLCGIRIASSRLWTRLS